MLKQFLRLVMVPSAFYTVAFIVYTYPAILSFSSQVYADSFDGLVHFWNLWWIHKALVELHTSIWHTTYLYFPYGISLYAHSLNPINGLMSLPLQQFFTLIQTHNVIVMLSFILSGLTTFKFCFYLTRSFWGSLFGGFVYSFSGYHFAHAEGHMELITMQWIPLFMYYWIGLLDRPKHSTAIKAALCLFLNLLATPYYFIFCVLAAGLALLVRVKQKTVSLKSTSTLFTGMTFAFSTLLLAGYYLYPLFSQIHHNVTLAYRSEDYSMDLLAPFVFGGHSRFGFLTEGYWRALPGNIHETSLYVGVVPVALFIYVFVKNKKNFKKSPLLVWYILAVVFFVFSLGPVLHVAGKEVWSFFMPYSLFEFVWSFMKIGTPIRLFVITQLALSVIVAFGFADLFKRDHRHKLVMGIFTALLFVEYAPAALTLSDIKVPQYVTYLKNQPKDSGVIDLVAYPSLREYYQTIHEVPVQLGYLSRIPQETVKKSIALQDVIDKKNYKILATQYRFRYWVNPEPLPSQEVCPTLVHAEPGAFLYDLTLLSPCN